MGPETKRALSKSNGLAVSGQDCSMKFHHLNGAGIGREHVGSWDWWLDKRCCHYFTQTELGASSLSPPSLVGRKMKLRVKERRLYGLLLDTCICFSLFWTGFIIYYISIYTYYGTYHYHMIVLFSYLFVCTYSVVHLFFEISL